MSGKNGHHSHAGCGCGGSCSACQARPAVLAALSASGPPAADAPADVRLAALAVELVEAGAVTHSDDDGWGFADTANAEQVASAQALAVELAHDGDPADVLAEILSAASTFAHDPFEGSHSHPHPAYGAQGDDATHDHDHEHSHSSDSSHSHDHGSMSVEAPAGDEPAPVDPPAGSGSVTAPFSELVAAGAAGALTPWGYLPSPEALVRARLRDEAVDAAIAIVDRERQRLTAADGQPNDRWHAYLFVEGLRTTDGRAVAQNALTWREFPLPLEWARAYEGGHYGKVVVGAIESAERIEGPAGITLWYGQGSWDLDSEDGAECARQVELQGGTRWVSADIEPIRTHIESTSGGEVDFLDVIFGDVDGDIYEVLDEGRGMGATVVSTPAFPQCCICPANVDLPVVEPMESTPDLVPNLVAAAVQPPAAPPAAWFENPAFAAGDPRLAEVTDAKGRTFRGCPLTVADDGRVYGHVALWNFCHTGFPNECVLAPRSRSGYAYFRTGSIRTAEGQEVPVGQLTVGTKHADGHLRHTETARHYDHTGMAVADLAAGEDDYGIWVSGALRPGITDDQLRAVRASSPSGDWRLIGGSLELVAVLDVNVPGFPVPRSLAASLVAAGAPAEYDAPLAVHHEGWGAERRVVALTAAGRVPRNPLREFVSSVRTELAALRGEVEALRPLRERYQADIASAADELANRLAVPAA